MPGLRNQMTGSPDEQLLGAVSRDFGANPVGLFEKLLMLLQGQQQQAPIPTDPGPGRTPRMDFATNEIFDPTTGQRTPIPGQEGPATAVAGGGFSDLLRRLLTGSAFGGRQ